MIDLSLRKVKILISALLIIKWGLRLLVTLARWPQAVASLLFISSVPTNTALSPSMAAVIKKKKKGCALFL